MYCQWLRGPILNKSNGQCRYRAKFILHDIIDAYLFKIDSTYDFGKRLLKQSLLDASKLKIILGW